MKLVISITIFIVFFLNSVFRAEAQVPQVLGYQSIIKENGILAANTNLVIRISIIRDSPVGEIVYVETHSSLTNQDGIANLLIGNGIAISGSISNIKWSEGIFYLKEEVSFGGSGFYTSVDIRALNSVPYSFHSLTAENLTDIKQKSPALYKVGDYAHGGIVFYVDSTGTRGLVCAIADLFASSWHNTVNKMVNAFGDGYGGGKENTMLQVLFQGNDNVSGDFAAKSCLNYSTSQGGVLYGDWYLPSKWELNQMFLKKDIINSIASKAGGTIFSEGFNYWSSSEYDSNRAWYQRFDVTGLQNFDTKNYTLEIRPIRAFSGAPVSNPLPANDQDTVWKQKEFVLSTFFAVGGSGDKVSYEKILSQTRDAGINHVELTFLSTSALKAALDVSEVLGIKTIAQDLSKISGFQSDQPSFTTSSVNSEINVLRNYKHLEGYFVWDEPHLADLSVARNLKDIIKVADPGRLGFTLCFPSYGDYTWSNNTYKSYVDNYVSTINPDVISFDYYPFRDNIISVDLINNEMWRDYGYLRKKSIEYDKPLWFYFQAVGMKPGEASIVNLERIRAQMYSGLAYGVKGLSYYTTFGVLLDSVTFDKKPIYEDLKSLNGEVKNLGNFLLNKKSEKLYHTGIQPQNHALYFLDDISQSTIIKSTPNNLIIGVFNDEHSTKKYILIVNKNLNTVINDQIILKDICDIIEFDKRANVKRLVSSDSDTLNISLDAGEAALYVVDIVDRSNSYKVGDFAYGGVVFWVDSSGKHGLVCSKENIPSRNWFNGVARKTFATGDGVYAGKKNTLLQVAFQGNDNPWGDFAAKSCLNYSITENGILYGDWYLPSKWELNEMYKSKDIINTISVNNGGTTLHNGFFYWSSTENDTGNAWFQNLSTTGAQGFDSKNYNLEIRPIRAF